MTLKEDPYFRRWVIHDVCKAKNLSSTVHQRKLARMLSSYIDPMRPEMRAVTNLDEYRKLR